MGSFARRVGAVATVTALSGMGVTALPVDAYAMVKRRVPVACNTPALITAITNANAVRMTTLELAANCTYDLTAAAEVGTRGGNGLPIIREYITLVGSNTTIRRNAVPEFRIAEVNCGGTLVLRGVTISGGDSGANTGGALLNARGTLSLISSMVTGNTGDNGAGISNDRGTAYVYYSTVSNNTTGSGGGGGGIYNDGTLFVYGSVLTGNTANTSGGAIHTEQGAAMNLTSSTVSANQAGTNGGGIHNGANSAVTYYSSLLSVNSVTGGDGGGTYNLGRLIASNTRFYGNAAAAGGGGGIRNGVGAGTVVLNRSRVDYNRALSGGGINNTGNSASQVGLSNSVINPNTPNNCVPLSTITGCVG